MPRLALWNYGAKSNDYKFIDRMISEYFFASGTGVLVHKYLGTYDQTADGSTPADALTETSIQDVLFLENRDRKYDPNIYDMRGCYSVQDNDFNLLQFGLSLSGDTLFIEFHLSDMFAMLGRKLMNGDVLELPHQRDDMLLDPSKPAINKFYVVTDANRAASGYSATWLPHIWRVKVEPMQNQTQYDDILQAQAENPFGLDTGKLADIMTSVGQEMAVNEGVIAAAVANVKARNFETRHFWVNPGDETAGQYPWIFAGDGAPPDGFEPLGAGNVFPKLPSEGDYYLRTDYDPHTLFRFKDRAWRPQEQDYRRGHWSIAHRLMEDFINERGTTTFRDNGEVAPIKQALYKAVKPREDF